MHLTTADYSSIRISCWSQPHAPQRPIRSGNSCSAAVDAPRASCRKQTAVISGGCFWGVQAVFQHVKGVISSTSGYSGGSAKTAEYETVSTGETGHAESVKVFTILADHLRRTLARLLFGRARSHRTKPPGPRQRHAIPFLDFLQQRRAEAHCGGVHSAAGLGEDLPKQDRDQGSSVAGILSGGSVSPELRRAASEAALYCVQ